jgi:hypothetical protein
MQLVVAARMGSGLREHSGSCRGSWLQKEKTRSLKIGTKERAPFAERGLRVGNSSSCEEYSNR